MHTDIWTSSIVLPIVNQKTTKMVIVMYFICSGFFDKGEKYKIR